MDSGPTLFISLIVIVIVGVTINVALFRFWKKQKLDYPKHWEEFEALSKTTNHADLISIGNKLIYNKHLSQKHLTIIHETAIELEARFPEFESLRLNAYNKQLHYNRPLPGIGSSGGVKQFWSEKK